MSRSLAALPLVLASVATACGGAEGPPPVAPAPTASAPPAPPPAAAAPIKVRLLAFNDFHGNIKPPTGKVPGVEGEVGGAAWFAAHAKKLGAGQPNTLVVAAGDLVGASPLSSALFHDEPTVAVMNAVGLTATSLGNHEFDEGWNEVLRLKKGGCHPKDGCKFDPSYGGAKYDILAANVTVNGAAPGLPAWVEREVQGVKIALVGMPLKGTPHALTPEAANGLVFDDEVKVANALVPEIRAKGIETIVLLIHEGGEVDAPSLDGCKNLRGSIVRITEKLDPAYDVVVSGHSHQLYNCVVAKRPVTSALAFGRVLTTIDLTIDPKTKDVVSFEAHNHAVTHDLPPDPEVAAIVDRAVTSASTLENRIIGKITAPLYVGVRAGLESALAAVVADAELEATKKAGAKVALVNLSGVRSDILFAKSGDEKEDGLVTYGEAFAAQPFGNGLVTLTITAQDLMTMLESGLRHHAEIQPSEGVVARYVVEGEKKKIVALEINGKKMDPKAPVRLTTNSYLADRDTLLKNGTDRVVGPSDIDAFEAYFKNHAKVAPPKGLRFVGPDSASGASSGNGRKK